jgi:putative transposase
MSQRANCWVNALAMSFFASLKKDGIKKRIYKNRVPATADVSNYIDAFYKSSQATSPSRWREPGELRVTC